ncbi:MAG: hypothetical protein K1W31_12460 [Lachnospiraceae bacterium]
MNALSEVLYGTGELKGVKDAFLRGARTGAVMSGLENITNHVGSYGVAGEQIFGKKADRAVIPTNAGRDPKGMCGAADPFDLSGGLGNGRGYQSGRAHGGAGHSRTGENGGFSLGGFVKDVLTGAVVGGLGSVGFYGAGKAVEVLRGSVAGHVDDRYTVPKPNHGQGFSKKGYFPEPGERTFEGYVWSHADPEISLYTKAEGFNNSKGVAGGKFKRLGAQAHYKLSPHVHQPTRHIAPDGTIYGKTGKTVGVDTLSPDKRDIKQLYEYLNNGKYHQ